MQLSRCPSGVGSPGGQEPSKLDAVRYGLEPDQGGMPCWNVFQVGGARLDSDRHVSCLPRKEVIQPHLPVRLPCYDFTPLTLHTFGASPLERLGRRLRVQTTRVV